MKIARPFFSKGDAADAAYRLLRDGSAEYLVVWRDYTESLWRRYDGNNDANFLGRAKASFLACFWEMYLWVSMEECGYTPVRVGSKGPEFYISLDGRRFWVEAICPGRGDGVDAIPVFPLDGHEAHKVHVESILLRYATTVRKKVMKHIHQDVSAGRAREEDGYLLAISSSALPLDARCGAELPYIVKAAYGLGALTLPIDRKTSAVGQAFHVIQEDVRKFNETTVSMGFLLDDRYPCLSGIIHSVVNFTNNESPPGADFELLVNSRANVAIPQNAFSSMLRWRVEGDFLIRRTREI